MNSDTKISFSEEGSRAVNCRTTFAKNKALQTGLLIYKLKNELCFIYAIVILKVKWCTMVNTKLHI